MSKTCWSYHNTRRRVAEPNFGLTIVSIVNEVTFLLQFKSTSCTQSKLQTCIWVYILAICENFLNFPVGIARYPRSDDKVFLLTMSSYFLRELHIPWVCCPSSYGGVLVVPCCWEDFQCWGVLLDNGYRAEAYCACSRCGVGLFGHFSLVCHFLLLSPSLWGTARCRLKCSLKGR